MPTNIEPEKDPLAAVKACLLIDDDAEALPCVEELIKNWPEDEACKPSLVLLTQPGCLPCKEERQTHAAAIEAGIMQIVDIHSPRGREIAKKNEVLGTPAILVLDCNDFAIEEERVTLPEETIPEANV